MIYTIGYARLTPKDLVAKLDALDAILVDVRSRPTSRKPGFSQGPLQRLLGDRYVHRPDLGADVKGWAKGWRKGMAWLYGLKRNAILMCLEEEPALCHRHRIVFDWKVPAYHIYRDHLVEVKVFDAYCRDPKADHYESVPFDAFVAGKSARKRRPS